MGNVNQPDSGSSSLSSSAYDETPAGVIDGVNAVYTLVSTPSPATSLQLYKTDIGTAVFMVQGIHYNLAGFTITYTAGNEPAVGQTHRAFYAY